MSEDASPAARLRLAEEPAGRLLARTQPGAPGAQARQGTHAAATGAWAHTPARSGNQRIRARRRVEWK